MRKKKGPVALDVPEETMAQWQGVVDIIADLVGVPAGLIMRVVGEHIEVLMASHSKGNPYRPGDREHLANSGLYCETVIRTREPLLVPDALTDPAWRDNPDVKLNMISYLGFPIFLPDDTPFGTICILDNKSNAYSDTVHELLAKFRDLIEMHLDLLYMNAVLGEKNKSLADYLDELQKLRGMITICASCKKIKDEEGFWVPVEKYLIHHPEADFSHGYCPDCYKKTIDQLNNF